MEDEGEKNKNPHPICASETRAVEERERGEEGAAKSDQSREGELPFPTGGVHDHLLLHLGLADGEKQGLSTLYEKQENQ